MASQQVPFGAGQQFGIAEILQMLSLGGRSGTLTLSGPTGRAVLIFANGRILSGDLLPPAPSINLSQLPRDAQLAARRADVQRVLVELLHWKEGTAGFQVEEVQSNLPLFDVDSTLIDAVRTLDEWQQAGNSLPSPGECLRWPDTPPAQPVLALSGLERDVITSCNGRVSLAEIARRLHAPDLDVAQSAKRLLEHGFLTRDADGAAVSAQTERDVRIETALGRRIVELQVKLANATTLRSRAHQWQELLGVLIGAVDQFAVLLCDTPDGERVEIEHWIEASTQELQDRYVALQLLTFADGRLDSGDLVDAYAALAGATRESFYGDALHGLYALLTRFAVRLVEEHISGRVVGERLRSTVAALLLELEDAIRVVKPPAPTAPDGEWSALRQQHFQLIA